MDQRPLSLIAYNRKTAILRGQIWPTHESDVVGLPALAGRHDNGNLICLTRQPVNAPHPAIRTESGVAKKGGILLANLFQGSSSTFSGARFPAFLAFKEGMWDTHIAALLGSPTVSVP